MLGRCVCCACVPVCLWVGGWVVVSLQARAGSFGLHAWPGVLPAAELPGWAASLPALACALPGNRSALAHSAPAPPPPGLQV